MQTTPAAITAAAIRSTSRPSVSVTLSDRTISGAPRLDFASAYAGSETAGNVASCITRAGTHISARVDGTTVYWRRVANPSASSTWSGWNALIAGAVNGTPVALVTWADHVWILYNSTGNVIAYRQSRDDGSTWDVAVAGPTAVGTVTAIAAAVRTNSQGIETDPPASFALFVASNNAGTHQLHGYTITPDFVTFASAVSSGLTWATITAIAATYHRDYELLVTGTLSTPTRNCWGIVYGCGTQATIDTFSARWTVDIDTGTATSFTSPTIANVGGHLCFAYEDVRTATVARRRLLRSYVPDAANGRWIDEAFREPVPIATGTASTPWTLAADDRIAVLCQASTVAIATHETEAEYTEVAVARLDWSTSPSKDHATITLAPGQTIDDRLQVPGTAVDIALGYDGTTLTVARLALVDYSVDDTGIVLECDGVHEALRRWSSRQAINVAAAAYTIAQQIALLCARAGVAYPTQANSASTPMSTAQPALAVRPAESAAPALARILSLVPEVPHANIDGSLRLWNPSASDASSYTIGVAHPILSAKYSTVRPPFARSTVFSSTGVDDAIDTTEALAQQPGEEVFNTPAASSSALLTAIAAARVRKATMQTRSGYVDIRPHPGLQVSDIVTITDTRRGLSADRRIAGVRIRWEPRTSTYTQRLELSAP